jgi:uncharacterized protein DUF4262
MAEDLEDYLRDVKALVEKHGWIIQAVQPRRGEGGPTFAYTVGLIERGCAAEIMVTGLPVKLLHAILNQIAASMANGTGMPPTTWDLPGGYVMLPVFITKTSEPLVPLVAMQYYQRPGVPVVQYVWPAEDGSYPWQQEWPHDTEAQLVGGAGRPLES